MTIDLTGRTALVTGGAKGIGQAVARTLNEAGAVIALADVSFGRIAERPAWFGAQPNLEIPADVSLESSVMELYAAVIRHFGQIDIVVNCAGILRGTPILDLETAEWDQLMGVNLRGTFLIGREAFRHMRARQSGKIVNIASVAGKSGSVLSGVHYSASKAGVISLTKTFALQAAPFHINVNAVCPGPIETEMISIWAEQEKNAYADRIPLKCFGKPQDVADAVAFLVSDKARYITGEILDVNGGVLMD